MTYEPLISLIPILPDDLEEGEVANDEEDQKKKNVLGSSYGPKRTTTTKRENVRRGQQNQYNRPSSVSLDNYFSSSYRQPVAPAQVTVTTPRIKNAHLLIHPTIARDLRRRVDNELARCCHTNLSQLQRKIDSCKVSLSSVTRPTCRDIFNDLSMPISSKLERYQSNMRQLDQCADYRNTLERAFAQESDFSDVYQRASYEGHRWQRLELERMVEECRIYYERFSALPTGTNLISAADTNNNSSTSSSGALNGYLNKIYN